MCVPGDSDRRNADREIRLLEQQIAQMQQTPAPDMADILSQQMQLSTSPLGRTRRSTFAPPDPPLGFHVMRSLMQRGGR